MVKITIVVYHFKITSTIVLVNEIDSVQVVRVVGNRNSLKLGKKKVILLITKRCVFTEGSPYLMK